MTSEPHKTGATDSLSPAEERALLALVAHVARERKAPLPTAIAADLPDVLVRRHLLAPLAYRAGVECYRGDYIASALTAELRAKTLREAADALAKQGVRVILYKGIAYAGRLYADPAERPMSDIDLMVPPADHERASRVLRRLGYWVAGSNRQASRFHHAVCFKRKSAAIDLHRSVMQPWRSRIDLAGIWRRARPIAPAGDGSDETGSDETRGALHLLDPVDAAVLHLAHIARHELRVPAVNYVDSIRLLAPIADGVERVIARARDFRIRRGVASALAMSLALGSRGDLAEHLNRCGIASIPARLGALPSIAEVIADRSPSRPLQLARKLALTDGPRELLGLLAAGIHGKVAHRFRP